MQKITLKFEDIARKAGFEPAADGKLNLPATQDTADRLASVANSCLYGDATGGEWAPGDPPVTVTLTGAGPVWGYLAIAHALHGRCAQLIYAAPNATIVVWSHGVGAEPAKS